MNQFFKELAEAMNDRQESILNIKKIGDDLVIMVTPDIKKKGTVIQMTGSPEEMDLNFLHEYKKTPVEKTEFSAEVVKTEEEEEENVPEGSEKGREKKKAAKKAVKDLMVKKAEEKKQEKKEKATAAKEKKKVEEKTEPVDEKKIAEQAAADKLKADKEQFETLMIEGKKLMDERKYSEAEAIYKSAIELFPTDGKANFALANATKWVKAMEKLNATQTT